MADVEFTEPLRHPLDGLPEPQEHYDSGDPFTNRYFDPELSKIFSEEARIAYQGLMEAALARGLAMHGLISVETADSINRSRDVIDAKTVTEHERKVTKHDIRALGDIMRGALEAEDKPWLHFGATSYDIISNATTLQYRDAIDRVIVPRMIGTMSVLANMVEEHDDTVQVGRTHLQHGVPTTFGHNMAKHLARMCNAFPHLIAARNDMYGKFSGAVGAYNATSLFVSNPVQLETDILDQVDLEPATYSTQIVMPEQTIRLITEMEVVSAILANLGRDIRLMSMSEIGEVAEGFKKDQVGSSTMSHKKNPINSENMEGLHDTMTGDALSARLQLMTDLQRDLTDSAPSRFFSRPFSILGKSLKTAQRQVPNLGVFPDRMRKNLEEVTNGSIASEALYLTLQRHGFIDGHTVAKDIAHNMGPGKNFSESALEHPVVQEYWGRFSDAEKAAITDPANHYVGIAAERARTVAGMAREMIAEYSQS